MTRGKGKVGGSGWVAVQVRGQCLAKLKALMARSRLSSGLIMRGLLMAADPDDWDPGAQPQVRADGTIRKRKDQDDE